MRLFGITSLKPLSPNGFRVVLWRFFQTHLARRLDSQQRRVTGEKSSFRRSLILATTLVVSSIQGAAGSDKCANPVTTAEMAECSGKEQEIVERNLKQTYQRLRAELIKTERKFKNTFPDKPPLTLSANLASAQKDWSNFRLQSCRLEYQIVLNGNPDRGDYSSLAEAACETKMARDRVAELNALVKTYDINLAP